MNTFTQKLFENDYLWSFSYYSFVKLHGKHIGSHMTVLYANEFEIELCYKGTTLFFVHLIRCKFSFWFYFQVRQLSTQKPTAKLVL